VTKSTKVRIVVWGSLAIASVAVLYRYYATSKVNRLINESDALVEEGDAKGREIGPDFSQYLHGPISKEDRAKLEVSAPKATSQLAEVIVAYRGVATKFDEAKSVAKTALISTEYLDLMSQAYQSRADSEEAHRKAVALLVDKTIKSEEELQKQRDVLVNEARKLESDFERLQMQATKVKNAKLE
jgi:hypothetical protein